MIRLAKGHFPITLALLTPLPIIFILSLLNIWFLLLLTINSILLIGHLFFFRDPSRTIITDSEAILAPADGKIYEIIPSRGIIRIRMSLFNVHVNRWPVSGIITNISTQQGQNWPFLPFLRKGTEKNARQIIELKNDKGNLRVIQIVGIFARRCIVYYSIGESIIQGKRLGMIRYGSEVDITFPPEVYEIIVKERDKTIAGITKLARLIK
ncbi:MAG: phosphatidylserine decarboxylase [Candidatus Hodarchaeales archaeon]|jgi:phosphatidylserine decarboxylase